MALGLFIGIALGGAMPAHAGYESWDKVPDNIKKDVITPMWDFFIKDGYSEEAAAGLLGNANDESTFQVSPVNMIGCVGLFQWCGGRKDNLVASGDWKTVGAQLAFWKKETDKNPWFTPPQSRLESYMPGTKGVKSLDEFKKLKSPSQAAVIFSAGWEIPCVVRADGTGGSGVLTDGSAGCSKFGIPRAKAAEWIFKGMTGREVSGSNPEAGKEEGDKKKDEVTLEGGGAMTKEDDLRGMPSAIPVDDGYSGVTLPEAGSLGTTDGISLQAAKDGNSLASVDIVQKTMRTIVSFVGLILLFWVSVLFIAFAFDKANTVVEVSGLKVVSFGKLHMSEGEDDTTAGAVSAGKLAGLCVLVVLVAWLILSGKLYDLFYFVITYPDFPWNK